MFIHLCRAESELCMYASHEFETKYVRAGKKCTQKIHRTNMRTMWTPSHLLWLHSVHWTICVCSVQINCFSLEILFLVDFVTFSCLRLLCTNHHAAAYIFIAFLSIFYFWCCCGCGWVGCHFGRIYLGSWTAGRILCEIWISLDILLCTASILSLCAISLDRYLCNQIAKCERI